MKKILPYERTGDNGSNITLVFLHGSTMTKGGMYPFASVFKEYNCIVFDLTGHGQSDTDEPDNISVFAEDVEYSLSQLKEQNIVTGQVILLGYSMGGAITCEIAIRNNLSLSGIVLLSSGGDLKNYSPMIDDLKAMPVEEFKTEDKTGYADLMLSNGYNNLEACKAIKVPALMVHGSDDMIVEPMAAVETWRTIEGSQLLMVPYKGHGAIYEDTEFIKDKIISFIKMCS